MRYADAGVNITVADEAKRRIAAMAGQTFRRGVLAPIGGFGSLFQLDKKRWRDAVLVASCDGVGTKLKVASAANIHSTVGADILNHCVNDILTQGAEPLFFLDYIAMGKLDTRVLEQVIEGLSRAAKQAGCSLIGGETAEMPDLYAPGDYDLAGFIVGAVERKRILDPRRVRPGDLLLALPSSGLHTNGYSLARKLIFETAGHKPGDRVPALKEKAGAALMKIHRSYLPVIRQLTRAGVVAGMAHITGGGITENLPRVLPKNISAEIDTASWPLPPLFAYLQQLGNVPQDEMLRTFNMGIGLIAVIPQSKWKRAQTLLGRLNEPFHVIGQAVKGDRSVRYRS
jgi:phosphoribosylformylglycinamidine cyclo-ligase